MDVDELWFESSGQRSHKVYERWFALHMRRVAGAQLLAHPLRQSGNAWKEERTP
jgi:hypothetical protein